MGMPAACTVRAAAIAAIGIVAACASTQPQPYSWKPPGIGSSWEMALRNSGSYGHDKRVQFRLEQRVWNGTPMLAYLQPDGSGMLRTADHGRVAVVLGPGGRTLAEYAPPSGLSFPIKVGDRTTTQTQLTIPGRPLPPVMEMTCVVEAFEKVSVAAGTFDAYRTVCTPSSGKSTDTFWMSPQLGINVKTAATRTADSNFGAGEQVAELVSYSIR